MADKMKDGDGAPPAGGGQPSPLAQKLIAAGYTPEEVATAAGVEPAVIKRWFNGEIPDPPNKDLIQLLEQMAATPKG